MCDTQRLSDLSKKKNQRKKKYQKNQKKKKNSLNKTKPNELFLFLAHRLPSRGASMRVCERACVCVSNTQKMHKLSPSLSNRKASQCCTESRSKNINFIQSSSNGCAHVSPVDKTLYAFFSLELILMSFR